MNTLLSPLTLAPNSRYETTRFNALRHGVLSRHTVLPWEDQSEYESLLNALAAEHAPDGPTEEHVVEELAGIIWRKRRLRMAEAAVYREKLRHDATGYQTEHLVGAALLPLTGSADHKANIPQALAATRTDTAGDLRDVKRDQAMTRKALNILVAGGPDAYGHAVAALREDTRSYWQECLAERRDDATAADAPTADMLKTWIERHWEEWYDDPIAELENRDAIRDQVIGAAYAAHDLDMPVRYEIHLDRKLERTLAMLFRLKELRQPARRT
jgi:hypothetical protein